MLKFAVVFVALSAAGKLAQERFHESGFLVVAIFGGFISSASTTAAAATLVAAGHLDPTTGGIATVLTSMTSALVNMPLVYQQTQQVALTRRLAVITSLIVVMGLASLVAAWTTLCWFAGFFGLIYLLWHFSDSFAQAGRRSLEWWHLCEPWVIHFRKTLAALRDSKRADSHAAAIGPGGGQPR